MSFHFRNETCTGENDFFDRWIERREVKKKDIIEVPGLRFGKGV